MLLRIVQVMYLVLLFNIQLLSVRLTTSNGNIIDADHVIVTVSMGVLKSNQIAFNPPLPVYKTNAIHDIGEFIFIYVNISFPGFGTLGKVILVFDQQFWPDEIDEFQLAADWANVDNSVCENIK
jgi:hypothetical protein